MSDLKTAPKNLKTNGTKTPMNTPLLVGNRFITGFAVNLFNDYFSQQCTIISNGSSIPANITFKTKERLPTFEIRSDDIVKFIRSLDLYKAHEHDEISIRLIETCDSPISKPLAVIFKNCFENECFPKEWKRANIVPVDKKNINNRSQIINQNHYCLFVLKFLKK